MSEQCIHPLEEVSEFQEDRLKIAFTPSPHHENHWLVKLADRWTGLSLFRQDTSDGVRWWVVDRPHLGSFRVRGEAVFAAILTTFDPD